MATPLDRLETWRGWIGREEIREEQLSVEALRRFAAAVGGDLDVLNEAPALAHWAFFLPVAANAELGDDGHPARGGFLPPVSLPRRMFAASNMAFHQPLALERAATLRSVVADVKARSGRSGDLVFVEVSRSVEQDGQICVAERQTIVYREAGAPTPTPALTEEAPPGAEVWRPGTTELFRFSAVTFNSHRIHYDLPYATTVEGYPQLVVHGPLTAVKLFQRARRRLGANLRTFQFRALSPLFAGQPVWLTDGPADRPGAVRAVRCDGAVAMEAEVRSND